VTTETPLHLFQGYGVELEYAIVDSGSLDVLPIADRVLESLAGEPADEVAAGDLAWSNELALHVLELKVANPVTSLDGLHRAFQEQVTRLHDTLSPLGARLMPTAVHPWMNPRRETRLWPHNYSLLYRTFHRIFDCHRHGWSNLQSVHINLPFYDDEEFARLHAAIRLTLPLIPALAASSPVLEGMIAPNLDQRLEEYRCNSRSIPSITGRVIPEPNYTRGDYETRILNRMYADIAPYDPEGILQEEWLNSRGAIARFVRNTIEIRLVDMQECPRADLAICWALVHVIRALTDARLSPLEAQRDWPADALAELLAATIRDADRAMIANPAFLQVFGICKVSELSAGGVWARLLESVVPEHPDYTPVLEHMLRAGPLSRRILACLGPDPSRERLSVLYRDLCDGLICGRILGL